MRCRVSPWLALEVILYIACVTAGIVLGRSIISPRPDHVSCTDLSLQFAYNKDTICLMVVIITCVLLPAPVIFLTEWLMLSVSNTEPQFEAQRLSGSRSRVGEALNKSSSLFWDLLVGMGMAYLLLEILKVGTASPRPNFWDTCGNDTHLRLCGNSNFMARVNLHECSNPHNLKWMNLADAAKSFPSGHSCFAAFTALFFTVYFHRRLQPSQAHPPPDSDRDLSAEHSGPPHYGWLTIVRRWLPLPWVVWAVVVSVSRLWDHKHHWHDVLGGAVLGIVMATYTIVVVTQNFGANTTGSTGKSRHLELNTYRTVAPE